MRQRVQHSPGDSTTFAAKTLPLPCSSAKTVPVPSHKFPLPSRGGEGRGGEGRDLPQVQPVASRVEHRHIRLLAVHVRGLGREAVRRCDCNPSGDSASLLKMATPPGPMTVH